MGTKQPKKGIVVDLRRAVAMRGAESVLCLIVNLGEKNRPKPRYCTSVEQFLTTHSIALKLPDGRVKKFSKDAKPSVATIRNWLLEANPRYAALKANRKALQAVPARIVNESVNSLYEATSA